MNRQRILWLSEDDPADAFPPLEQALEDPNGLLAAGGDLSPGRLLHAYRAGIFPWFESGQPILWWSPDPRCVIRPEQFHVSRSLRRAARTANFKVTFNRAFREVIEACSVRRNGQAGTWITDEMIKAYSGLHDTGWAHSVEVWRDTRLVGGIYGVASGRFFFGESMFIKEANASKIAMLALCHSLATESFVFLDCQVPSQHLMTLGATVVPREVFASRLAEFDGNRGRAEFWPDNRIDAAEFL
jgi:leucyl/phenylalanyl-tRNA--protein transferase